MRVRFYSRRVGEATFLTDPHRVAAGFLDHRHGRRAAECVRRTGTTRYTARFLTEYLMLKGAWWARYGDDDPYATRRSFDTVLSTVLDQLVTD